MINEITIKIVDEDRTKTLKKKLDPIHGPVSMDPDDPYIKQIIDEATREFQGEHSCRTIICRMTLPD